MQARIRNKYTRLSLASIGAMMVFTSIHHVFRLGYELVIPAAILTLMPFALMSWHEKSRSAISFGLYALYCALMFIWFGFVDGFLDHVLKAVGFENSTFLPGGEAEVVKTALSLWSPDASNLLYESTGVLTFVAGLVAMIYLVGLIRIRHSAVSAGPLISAQVESSLLAGD